MSAFYCCTQPSRLLRYLCPVSTDAGARAGVQLTRCPIRCGAGLDPQPAGPLIRTRYDDGGFSGGSTDRPALQQLLADIRNECHCRL